MLAWNEMDVNPGFYRPVDVQAHVHYIVAFFVLVIGTVGVAGNALVMYAFFCNKKLRTPPNIFIMNLAISCKIYAFCGALFGITSMINLLAISLDRYIVITKPLQAIQEVEKFGYQVRKSTLIQQQSIKTEWKLAKIAFVVIIVFVLSWSPYACVTLIAWAGYAHILSPYSKAVPAVIAKASAIYNPFIYAIIHSKYRDTMAEHVPCLHFLAQPQRRKCISVSHSDSSFRDLTLSRQSSVSKTKFHRVSSRSTTDTQVWSDVELDSIDQSRHVRSNYSLGALRDREHKSLAKQTKEMESQSKEQRGPLNRCDPALSSECVDTASGRRREENPTSWNREKKQEVEKDENEPRETGEKEEKEPRGLIRPDSLDSIVCVHSQAIIRPEQKNRSYCEEKQRELLLSLQPLDCSAQELESEQRFLS
ncbi:Melanopsin-B [Liparis tanakae]|uniref:Melanopsin-B n=1 Tax=Liparis tanakae TaxID=230148 RepID=A0A4Z2IU24_9TELE|nr:Melanopsin-B [Liparis tanakae]